MVLQEAGWAVLGMVTTFLVGHLGAAAITAVGLSEQIVFIPQVAFAGISVGATAIVARHVGAREPGQANRTLRQAIILAVILGFAFGFLVWFFPDQLLRVFRARPEVIVFGRNYIRVIAFTTVFNFVMNGGTSIFRGSGDTKTPMYVMLIVEIVGVSLAYILINGSFGLPALGVLGAGIARGTSSVVGGLLIMALLIRGKGFLKYDLRTALHFDLGETKRILKVGLPAFVEQLQMRGAMMIFTIIISSLGTTVYAAHALAMRVEELAFMPSFGFSVAATALVGQALGAKRPDLAEKAGYLAQRFCAAFMTTIGMITFFLGHRLIAIFISDPEVIRIGALGLKMWAFAMPGMATNNTFAGGLRGAGDTRWVLLLTAIGMWTMRVGGGALLVFVVHLGAPGAWAGAILDHNVRALLTWWRFASGKWKNIEV